MAKKHLTPGGQAAVAFGAQIEKQRARILSAMGVVDTVQELLHQHDYKDGKENGLMVDAWSALRAAHEIIDSACWNLGDLADAISARA